MYLTAESNNLNKEISANRYSKLKDESKHHIENKCMIPYFKTLRVSILTQSKVSKDQPRFLNIFDTKYSNM